MRKQTRFTLKVLLCGWIAVITGMFTIESAYGLYMSTMPENLMSKDPKPRERAISLKLPLEQPVFHWTFMNKEEVLAGRLTLRISRDDESTTITVFENGSFTDGWSAMQIENPRAGEVYFGFQSSKKYLTAPGDRIDIELRVKKDLPGIGPLNTGVLPAGVYKSTGSYTGLIDEYQLAEEVTKEVSEETIEKLRQQFQFRAVLENWLEQWPLEITGDQGWLTPEQRTMYQKTLERLK